MPPCASASSDVVASSPCELELLHNRVPVEHARSLPRACPFEGGNCRVTRVVIVVFIVHAEVGVAEVHGEIVEDAAGDDEFLDESGDKFEPAHI